jgi:hypothetical protein
VLLGESEKAWAAVFQRGPRLRPGRLSGPYYAASIVTNVNSNNVANTGDSLAWRRCATKDLTQHRDLYGQVSRAVWPPGGERVARLPLALQHCGVMAERALAK